MERAGCADLSWRAICNFESKTAKEEARSKILAAARRHGIEVDDDSKIAGGSR